MRKFFTRTRRQWEFAVVGIVSLLLGSLSLVFFVEFLSLPKPIAYALQTAIAIESNFWLNSALTWRDRMPDSKWRPWWRFHVSRIFTVVGNQALFTCLIAANTPYLLAHTSCVAASTVVNYLISDRIVFRQKDKTVLISNPRGNSVV